MTEKPAYWTSDDWHTPPEIVQEMAEEFGAFTLDPCALPTTAKAPLFYTRETDGLAQPWHGRVWLNPPYSDPGPWLRKAHESVESGACDLVVALVPASTDTRWFHDHVLGKAELRFRKGRIRFYGWQGTPIGSPKTPSVFAIYRRAAGSEGAEKRIVFTHADGLAQIVGTDPGGIPETAENFVLRGKVIPFANLVRVTPRAAYYREPRFNQTLDPRQQ